MRRYTALFIGLILTLTALTGCEKKPEGVFYELTGIDPAAAMLMVEGREVSAERYLYWVLDAADYIAGSFPELCEADGTPKWEAEAEPGVTVEDFILRDALDTAKMYVIVEKWAEEYGVTLSEASEEALKQELAAAAEQMGGQEAMGRYLASRGITEESYRWMARLFYLYANMLSLTKEEGSPLYISDETLYQYEDITPETVLADHILLLFPEDESQREAARESMEQVLSTIRSDEDPAAAFQYVADNYSEDEGRAYYPNGYLVTADAPYVQTFKDTALALEEYEISDVVESEFGWHIIMRKPLRDYVADIYLAEQITKAMEQAEVEWGDCAAEFSVEAFYEGYLTREEE